MEPTNCWCCHRLICGDVYSVPVAVRPAAISRNQKPVYPSSFTSDVAFDVGIVISKATRTTIDVTDREAVKLCTDWDKWDGEIRYDSNDRFMSTLVPKRVHTFGVFDTLACARSFARTFDVMFADGFRLDLLDEYWGGTCTPDGHDAKWEDGVEFGGDLEDWPPRSIGRGGGTPLHTVVDRIVPLQHHQTDL
jgi:hypothetical protein